MIEWLGKALIGRYFEVSNEECQGAGNIDIYIDKRNRHARLVNRGISDMFAGQQGEYI